MGYNGINIPLNTIGCEVGKPQNMYIWNIIIL